MFIVSAILSSRARSTSFIIDKNENYTVKVQKHEHLHGKMTMNKGKSPRRSSKSTHRWRELSDDGNQEPDDTLTEEEKHR